MKRCFLFIFLGLTLTGFSQREVDSLIQLFNTAEEDTVRIRLGIDIAETTWYSDPEVALDYTDQAIEISNKLPEDDNVVLKLKARCLSNKGVFELEHGDVSSAVEISQKALSIQQKIKDTLGMTQTMFNLAAMYDDLGDSKVAIEMYNKCMQYSQLLGDSMGVADALNNLGYTYNNQGDYEEALKAYQESRKLQQKFDDPYTLSSVYNNLGYTYRRLDRPDSSLFYYKKSLRLRLNIGDKKGVANSLNNIGFMYHQIGDLDSAAAYYSQSYEIRRELNHLRGMVSSSHSLGKLYLDKGHREQAILYAKESMQYAEELNFPYYTSKSASLLYMIHKRTGNYKDALKMYEIHIANRDSVSKEENQKAAIRQQTKYEFEKTQLIIDQKQKEESRKLQEQITRRNNLQYSLILIAVVCLLSFVFYLGKLKVSNFLAEGLIFFAFLIVFEFLLVLLDPYIENWAGGEPIYKLLFNAILAGAIFPLHAYFERMLKKRVIK